LVIALYYVLINFVLRIADRIIVVVKLRDYDHFRRKEMHAYVG